MFRVINLVPGSRIKRLDNISLLSRESMKSEQYKLAARVSHFIPIAIPAIFPYNLVPNLI